MNFEPEHWMQFALQLAENASGSDEVPIGALLIQEDRILGRGANTRERSQRTLAHAEILALEDYHSNHLSWRLPENVTLVSTVEPCLMCTGALLNARVENIFFGCSDPKNAGLLRMLPLIEEGVFDHRFKTVRGGILADSCGEILSEFFRRKRRLEGPRYTYVPSDLHEITADPQIG